MKWLAEASRVLGMSEIRTTLTKTSRNGPLRQVFSDLAFEVLQETDHFSEMRLDLRREIGMRDVARITADAGVFS